MFLVRADGGFAVLSEGWAVRPCGAGFWYVTHTLPDGRHVHRNVEAPGAVEALAAAHGVVVVLRKDRPRPD